MTKNNCDNGPWVIGGVGGSGTRVVAEILASLGVFIGNDINAASDNLLYTLLFKRPRWFRHNRTDPRTLGIGFDLLKKIMVDGNKLTSQELLFLGQAVLSMSIWGHNHYGKGKGTWPFLRLKKLFSDQARMRPNHIGWGWKEPNSHLLIKMMVRHFENFKYIHTIRHGLDMAFSKNQQQLFNWHSLYGVEEPLSPTEIPLYSFKFWLRANKKIMQEGDRLGPRRFLVINFENLCLSPEQEIEKILSFLKIKPTQEILQTCCAIPQKPKSIGRFRSHDLSLFDHDDLNKLTSFGFSPT